MSGSFIPKMKMILKNYYQIEKQRFVDVLLIAICFTICSRLTMYLVSVLIHLTTKAANRFLICYDSAHTMPAHFENFENCDR